MKKKLKKSQEKEEDAFRKKPEYTLDNKRLCDKEGCACLGEYKAPKDNTLSQYYWFCLEHVKAYNAQWDFYKDMDEDEIEFERKEDVCWHRPTWQFGQKTKFHSSIFSDPFGLKKEAFNNEEENDSSKQKDSETKAYAHLSKETEKELKKAFELLELSFPLELDKIKKSYKRLAKKYHPDSNGGDKIREEKFKDITQAYRLIIQTLNLS